MSYTSRVDESMVAIKAEFDRLSATIKEWEAKIERLSKRQCVHPHCGSLLSHVNQTPCTCEGCK